MYGLGNAEIKVMKVLWEKGDLTAKELSIEMNRICGWNQNTTYTLIKRCVGKGAIERSEPNYLCHAKATREEVIEEEMSSIMDRLFDGSFDKMFAAFAGKKQL
ncbi:MAG: BlaI/MecI/CopY family transcriptional regulator, partial [Lachnospiraceae bacterium]|nr:BlaI/MecI/CopY family transcriptional regulator [Lachnospiraceae bacterium]